MQQAQAGQPKVKSSGYSTGFSFSSNSASSSNGQGGQPHGNTKVFGKFSSSQWKSIGDKLSGSSQTVTAQSAQDNMAANRDRQR